MISTKINKVCAVIPFFNEEIHLRNVVIKTLNYVDEIIAVNDGSTDNSVDQIKGIEKVTLINIPLNKGKGYALKSGFTESLKIKSDITVTIDADMQHDPDYIPLLLNKTDSFDIVIGNRLKNVESMPYHRRISNYLTSFLLSKKLKVKIEDSQCGYRAYRTRIFSNIELFMNGFEAESEILVKAARNNFSIGFVDIPTIYADEKSKMRSFQAIKGFIKVLLS